MTAIVYVEGGGKGKALRASCREGFSRFFAKAGLKGRMPRVVPSGGRQEAFDDFRHAIDGRENNRLFVLLVDSEGPVAEDSDAWGHVRRQDGWAKPERAEDHNAHLMVQCMEAWFFADKDCLEAFFGRGFNGNALSRNPNIEEIPKNDLLAGLKNATRQCRPKGEYAKGRHGFAVLAETDPAKVLNASPHAKSLVETLMAHANRR